MCTLRICFILKTPLFLRSFDVAFAQQRQQILGHLMLCLFFFPKRAQIYVHWTGLSELPISDDDADEDDGIIHQTVSHTIKNIYIITSQYYLRINGSGGLLSIYNIGCIKWLLCVVKLLPFLSRCWKCIVNSLVYLFCFSYLLSYSWFTAFPFVWK